MNKFKLNIYNSLSIILSLFFVYGLVIIINDFDEIFSNISKVNVFIIMSATFVYFISVFFRYLRWKFIYKELIGNYKLNMFMETIIGYMANNIFPFRLGEIYRVKRVSDKESISFIKVLSTIFTERLTDILALLIFIIISLPFIKEFNYVIELDDRNIDLLDFGNNLVNYFIIITLFSIVFFVIYKLKIPLIELVISKLLSFIKSLTIFFSKKRSIKKYINLYILSFLIWFIEAGVYYIVSVEILPNHNKLDLLFIILFVCSITNLSGVIPSLPANIGGFEFFGTLAFLILGISTNQGASIIITVHLILFAPISLFGIIILLSEKLNLLKKK